MRQAKISVAFELTDPLGDRLGLNIESSESELRDARLRAHLHALNTQPRYKDWIFSNFTKHERRRHLRAAKSLKKCLREVYHYE